LTFRTRAGTELGKSTIPNTAIRITTTMKMDREVRFFFMRILSLSIVKLFLAFAPKPDSKRTPRNLELDAIGLRHPQSTTVSSALDGDDGPHNPAASDHDVAVLQAREHLLGRARLPLAFAMGMKEQKIDNRKDQNVLGGIQQPRGRTTPFAEKRFRTTL